MTPTQIIEQAKTRFDVLYLNDPLVLVAMMQDSLGVFEDKAGAIRSALIEAPATKLQKPSDFLTVSCVSDARGFYVDHTLAGEEIVISGVVKYPVTVKYLVKFRGFDFESPLPNESVGLILAHFAAQLEVRNTRRERAMASAAGLQVELTSEESLTARVSEIELSMEETASIIPMVTVV
jgi:hypothetical protein